MNIPTQSSLIFKGVTPGEVMPVGALTEGFFGGTPVVPPTMERSWRRAEVEDITTSQSPVISATPGVLKPSRIILGAIEQALMPMNRRSPRVDITMPPHVDRRAEILRTLDKYFTTTRQPHLTIDP